ncbi:MAG: phage shock protein PspC (stress-responsive transcriptional regulator) [Alphaproteobacteria bacterium]|jgi:phage shock protein PspC (stress-responsive transcriptional regulator)
MKTVLNDKRFFRDAQHAKISGVCAGIAKYFNISPWIVRGLTVSAFLFLPFAVGLAYVLAILLLRYK